MPKIQMPKRKDGSTANSTLPWEQLESKLPTLLGWDHQGHKAQDLHSIPEAGGKLLAY